MENEDQLDRIFYALADRRRRMMLTELAVGAKSIGELAELMELNISAASKHIAALEAADLLLKSRRGREVYCHLNFDTWKIVASYIAMQAKFWAGRLDELESYLKDLGAE